jgi:hypothetical protein
MCLIFRCPTSSIMFFVPFIILVATMRAGTVVCKDDAKPGSAVGLSPF